MPWANGGGSTRLLWSDPAGERRVSVAMLQRAVPFSLLPGMARLLIVLDPIVVALDVGGDRRTLRQREAIAFAGDDAVMLVSLDRPGRVVNLICRADRWVPSIACPARVPFGWIIMPGGDLVIGPDPLSPAMPVHFLAVDPARFIA